MSKYRKKPVEIEAVQFWPEGTREELDAMLQHLEGCTDWHMDGGDGANIVIPTLEGDMLAAPGDWIIKGVKGEFYPCKPDIFEATYEPVSEAPDA